MRKTLADIVVEEGLVDPERVVEIERAARLAGEPLIVTLVESEHLGEIAIVAALGRRLRLPLVELSAQAIDPDALREVPQEVSRRRRILPLTLESPAEGRRVLQLAMADPTDRDTVAEVELATGCRVVPALAPLGAIDKAVARAYRGIVTAVMPREVAERPAPSPRVPFGGDLAVATPAIPRERGGEPFPRMEDDTPVEQRHRALLTLLCKKGLITLEEYRAELRLLLDGVDRGHG